jgi:hypothetical protein
MEKLPELACSLYDASESSLAILYNLTHVIISPSSRTAPQTLPSIFPSSFLVRAFNIHTELQELMPRSGDTHGLLVMYSLLSSKSLLTHQ